MNHLLIIFDSVCYDIFKLADLRYIKGDIQKVQAQARWTLPSIMAILYAPYYIDAPLVTEPEYDIHKWLPGYLQEKGYNTALISDNPWFEIGMTYISQGFDAYVIIRKLGSTNKIFEFAKYCMIPPFFTL